MKNGPSHSTVLLVCATAPFVKGASCCSGISLVPSTWLSSSLSHFPVHPSFCRLPLSFNQLTSLSSVPTHYFLYPCHLFNIFLRFFFFLLFFSHFSGPHFSSSTPLLQRVRPTVLSSRLSFSLVSFYLFPDFVCFSVPCLPLPFCPIC